MIDERKRVSSLELKEELKLLSLANLDRGKSSVSGFRESMTLKVVFWIFALTLNTQHSTLNHARNIGLSTRFSDVILENLGIGASYNISQIKNLPLTVISNSSDETEVQVAVEAPTKEELKEGYEPIPDPTWVRVIPDRYRLAAGARQLSDILINIPDDPKLIGRHFQVMFWAHTLETGFLGVGVRVRVRFSVGSRAPETLRAEMLKKRMLDLNFRLEPVSLGAGEVRLGKTIDLRKEKNVTVKLVNTGSTKLKLKVESANFIEPQRPPQGYEALPDPKWLEVEPKILDSKPDTIVPLKIRIKIPEDEKYRDKKYAGLINVGLVGEEIPVNVYSQILMTTK